MRHPRACVAFVVAATLAGCSHADYAAPGLPATQSSASPTPTPTATATMPASSAACGSPVAGAVFIAMGGYIEPQATPDPTYGFVFGYALDDATNSYALKSSPIVLRPGDVVQFVNVDPGLSTTAEGNAHSAVGLRGAAFPATFAFGSDVASAVGTAVTNTSSWSTGRVPAVPAGVDVLCYSQPLTLPGGGTYAFGDLDYYASTNMRDVIVVSPSATR